MADPALALQTRIKGITEITAIVNQRIYRTGSVPTNPQMPYLIVNAPISDNEEGSTNTTNNSVARIQVDAFASTDPAVEAISQLLKKKVPCNDVILPAGTDFIRVERIANAGALPDQNTATPVFMRYRDFRIKYAD